MSKLKLSLALSGLTAVIALFATTRVMAEAPGSGGMYGVIETGGGSSFNGEMDAAEVLDWDGRANISSPADSQLLFTDDAGTTFDRVWLGAVNGVSVARHDSTSIRLGSGSGTGGANVYGYAYYSTGAVDYSFATTGTGAGMRVGTSGGFHWASGNNGQSGTTVTSTTSPTDGVVELTNTLKINDNGTKPTCNSGNRGLIHVDDGGAGVADTVEICGKDAADTYGWVALATF